MRQTEVEAPGVRVGAVAAELAREAVLRLQPELLPGADLGDRLELGVPAVVAQEASATAAAAARQASISVCFQRRGVPSWWTDRIAVTRPSRTTGVTICAARPP
jgi:hypothetical protein